MPHIQGLLTPFYVFLQVRETKVKTGKLKKQRKLSKDSDKSTDKESKNEKQKQKQKKHKG